MVKKVLACCFVLCSLAVAQYAPKWSIGNSDGTSYDGTPTFTSTMSGWKKMAGTNLFESTQVSQAGLVYGLTTSSEHQIKVFSVTNQTWTVLAGGLSDVQEFAPISNTAANGDTMVALRYGMSGNGGCTLPNYPLYYLSTSNVWTALNQCYEHITGGGGVITALQSVSGGATVYQSSDVGNTWTQLGGAGSFIFANSPHLGDACAVDTVGQVWTYNDTNNTWSVYGTQPPAPVNGCSWADVDPIFIAWSSTKMYAVNQTSGAWQTVVNPTSTTIKYATAGQKPEVFGIDASGYLWHWNVYPGYLSGTLAGSWTGCPGPSDPCPQGVTHTGNMQVKFTGRSISGNQGNWTGAPTAQMDAFSWDASPDCDLFYGAGDDPFCTPNVSAEAICNFSDQQLTSVDKGPPVVPTKYYVAGVPGSKPIYIGPSPSPEPGGWYGSTLVSVMGDCIPGTTSACVDNAIGEVITGNLTQVLDDMYRFPYTHPWSIEFNYNTETAFCQYKRLNMFDFSLNACY